MRATTLLVIAAGCGTQASEPTVLDVFAAASVAEAVAELGREFERAGGRRVRVNAAASSTLAHQIEAGAPADAFVSAHPEWLDRLERRGELAPNTRRVLAENRLVWVVPADGKPDGALEPLRFPSDHLAVGDPDHVPLGRYTRTTLEALGWWEQLSDRLLPALDARAALTLVELGEASAGIVYESDARASRRVRVASVFSVELSGPIRYEVAATTRAAEETIAFLDFLSGPQGKRVLERAGLRPVAP